MKSNRISYNKYLILRACRESHHKEIINIDKANAHRQVQHQTTQAKNTARSKAKKRNLYKNIKRVHYNVVY